MVESEDLDVEEIAEADPADLSDRELMLAIGAYAARKGEAEARRDHAVACADRRRSGVLSALSNAFEAASSRLSLREVEARETSADEMAAEHERKFNEYLVAASERFDGGALDPADDRAFW